MSTQEGLGLMYDCRQPLVDAVRVLATFGVFDTSVDDEPYKSPCEAITRFDFHYRVWTFNFREVMKAPQRRPLGELGNIAGEMLSRRLFEERGWEKDWDDMLIHSGRNWKNIRALATRSIPIAENLPLPTATSHSFLNEVPIIGYLETRIANLPEPSDLKENKEGVSPHGIAWYSLREDLVLVCGKHGRAGPNTFEMSAQFWVVDDCHNDERYQYVQILDPESLTCDWLADTIALLRIYPRWGIGISNLRDAYMLIFGDRLMVTGQPLENCDTAERILQAAARIVVT